VKTRRPPKLWWVSWEEVDSHDDPRPLHDPPNEAVLGWWCSGFRGDGSAAMMCALIAAPSSAALETAIAKDWPAKKARVWRFQNEVAHDFVLSDRFQPKEWMRKRMKLAGMQLEKGATA
jgi:hypothetical protein